MRSPFIDDPDADTVQRALERTVERDNRLEAVAQRKAEKTAQRASEERLTKYRSDAIF